MNKSNNDASAESGSQFNFEEEKIPDKSEEGGSAPVGQNKISQENSSEAVAKSTMLGVKRKKDMYSWDEKFVWNFYQIKEFVNLVYHKKWILPIVHGFIE
jgi:hypothetical protein